MSKTVAAAAALRPAVSGAPHKTSDRALLGRVATGDVAALRLVYEEHAPRALAIARRILRNVEEAEDIVQETFLELWRRAPQFDGRRGGLVAWIVTIARSRAIDRLRSASTAGRAVDEASATPDVHPVAPPSPIAETERRLTESKVADALAALPPEQRRAIQLAYFDGLSQTEIAARTNSPLGTVKMRVKLAVGKLKTLLKDD
ncbi:MAG TPA: sigma-70 family RNA polymerase sigma factor, partial [Polyangia bacterium]|nr:sigma-70 family RNA polymerase sigma factor [Polyangia bacterium]